MITRNTMTTCEKAAPNAVAQFLAEYTTMLYNCGATCIRMERNVGRIAMALGVKADMTLLPRHINLSVSNSDGSGVCNLTTPAGNGAVSFAVNTRLSRLSWRMADGTMTLEQAQNELKRIGASKGTDKWALLMLVPCANASFCRLFGGDMVAMCVVAIATLAGYLVKLPVYRTSRGRKADGDNGIVCEHCDSSERQSVWIRWDAGDSNRYRCAVSCARNRIYQLVLRHATAALYMQPDATGKRTDIYMLYVSGVRRRDAGDESEYV